MNTTSLKHFQHSLMVAFTLTTFSILFSMYQGWVELGSLSYMEVLATLTSFSCTYMCVKQTRWNYPMAIVSTALLTYVFASAGLYASAALNLYLIPTVIYGYFVWGKDTNTRPVEHVKWQILPTYAIFTVGAYIGAWLIVYMLGGTLAGLDSWLLIGSIFAQFLLDRKKIETWVIWISVNIVSIYVYFESGLYLLAIQFFFFLLNAVYGYWEWHKSMKHEDQTFDLV